MRPSLEAALRTNHGPFVASAVTAMAYRYS